ncbi:MAG: cytochrome c oxidase subunit II [Chitinophagales bacterium]
MTTTLLSLFAVFLFFLVIFYIAKTIELSSIAKNGLKNDYVKSTKVNAYLAMFFYIVGMIILVMTTISLAPRMLPESASVHGVEMDKMFDVTLWVTGLAFLLTQTLLFFFVYFYRYNEDRKAYFFPHSNLLEMIWTIVPAVVLVALVFKGIGVWHNVFDFQQLDGKDPIVFEVTGKQFAWVLRYPGADGKLGPREITHENINEFNAKYSLPNELGIVWTDKASQDDIYPNDIYLVKDRPVLVKLGALDVIHSFYLPHFRVKMDCVPGMPTQFMFTPMYTTEEFKERLKNKKFWKNIDPKTGEPRWKGFKFELACAELCGKSHFGMQKNVVVVEQEEYDAWLAKQKPFYKTVVKKAMDRVDNQ